MDHVIFNSTLGEFLLCLCVNRLCEREDVVVNVGMTIFLGIDLSYVVCPINRVSQKLRLLGPSIYLPKIKSALSGEAFI